MQFKAGDAFFCTQRLAHLLATNTKSDPTIFVFFEISHVDHAVLKDPALSSMWLEYKNVSYYLQDENAGIILTPTEVVQQDPYDLIGLDSLSISPPPAPSPAPAPLAFASPAPAPIPGAPIIPPAPATAFFTRSPSSMTAVPVTTTHMTDDDDSHEYNPLLSSQSGYAPLNNEEDGSMRPSNNIELNTFSSGKKY